MKAETLPRDDPPEIVRRKNRKEHLGESSENKTPTEMATEELRQRMDEMRQEILSQINHRLDDMMSEVLHKVKTAPTGTLNNFLNDANKYQDKRKSSKKGALPDKEFVPRNSLLTDLFEVAHIRAIYNIFMAILIILFINTGVHDLMETGRVRVGIDTMAIGFAKITIVAEIWLKMMAAASTTYVALSFWGHRRLDFAPKSTLTKIWDYGWLAVFVIFQISFMILPTKALLAADLPIASSYIILMEGVRMMMKTHAYVRSNAPTFLSYKPHTDSSKPTGPKFSQYLYFMFAPTLIYRNNYPRTQTIRWKFVAWNFLEVVMTIFCVAFCFERCVKPFYSNFGKQPMEFQTLLLAILGSSMPGMLIFLCGFYCLLHSWMNAWAELLRFADRLFYKDWWNSSSYDTYYRTWNVVVHDWLYTYVYKDMYEIVVPGNKLLALGTVFTLSAIFHELILAIGFRFFYPILMMFIGILSVALIFLKKYTGNLFIWWSLCVGNGFLLSVYTIEYFARCNCSPLEDGFLNNMTPISWQCHNITTNWNILSIASVD